MEYRKLDQLSISPSLLGFGCMRFPLNADGSIDEAEAERMIDYAIANGVNYIDTAYPYHNGDSEPFVGRVLKKYQRDSFFLATKLPMWRIETLEDAKNTFAEQLDRLNTEYVDFYLLHALNKDRWKLILDLDILSYCEELKAQGKIKYLGFSFHDEYSVFEEIINGYNWDFCQIQYNYVDTEEQAGDRGYQLATEKAIPVIVMEPIKGGSLAVLPEDIAKQFKAYHPDASISSWAMRWIASKSNVKVVLSGMSTFAQVEDNLATYLAFQPLNQEEQEIVANVAKTIKSRTKNGCTGCAYCMPCPFGIDIPKNFRVWNEFSMYGNQQITKQRYYHEMEAGARAEACKQCGKCEPVCPQAIAIREDLKQVVIDMPMA